MKNLVLGVAKGYDWHTLEPFVNSFKKNCPSAELVFFVDDVSEFTRDKLIRKGVIVEKFPDGLDGIPNNTRWKVFLDFLEVHGDEYEQIFITDTRDVIFQSDVFEQFAGLSNWLGCVTEVGDIRGSTTGNTINYEWIVSCFGKDEAEKIADQKVICCGTVIGSAAEMKILCRELWKILAHKTTDVFDQAVMNCLAYNGLLPIENLLEIAFDDGAIFTNGLIMNNATRGDFILRSDGGIPAVVHQYDRHENLLRLVERLYRDKNFSFDERFTDPRSLLEQSGCLLFADKDFDAAWLFLKVFFGTEEFGGYTNLLIEIWKIAVKKTFTRPVEGVELAIQSALFSVGVEQFSAEQLTEVQKLFVHAAKSNHVVDEKLRFSLASRLFKIAKNAHALNFDDMCFFYIKLIDQLHLPPDENFQRLFAEANQIFGRNA